MRMVKQDFRKHKYDVLLSAMGNKELFTTGLLTKYYDFINSQAEIIVEKIKVVEKGQLINSCPQLTYRSFVSLLNTVPLGFIQKTKLQYVNALIGYYNQMPRPIFRVQ